MALLQFPILAPGLEGKLQCKLIISGVPILFTQYSKGSLAYFLLS